MVYYVEYVFAENFLIDFILLFITGKLIKKVIVYKRLVAASIVGAAYVILAAYISKDFMIGFIVKFSVSILMLTIAFDSKGILNTIRVVLCFYIISLIMVGVITALYYLTYDRLTVNAIIISLFLGYIALHFFFREVKSRIDKSNYMRTVTIKIGECEKNLNAFIDTGNELVDPMTGKPVMVTNINSIRNILGEELYKAILHFYNEKECNYEKLLNEYGNKKLKIIRYNTISSKGEKLVILTPDNLKIKSKHDEIANVNAVIGIYPEKISQKEDYDALLFNKILEWEMEQNNELAKSR
ncbi:MULTISPECIES: sigma-E processing peptidase SpoIIGA [unclassified Sedimentibacter]|uniref:sigma-E processing peptidase SpoIIGA n=1 Tax=unclassified Sedimentibacter TaxID=2649220 RepID=UPI0027E0B7A7|nr:sigma-E processing peptidase SpoIIGA [Sedimentibacter sp. MB35-C1]WMJ76651.1 sigma-E processing peptidase SpoIIGA [Sedimentibacter sp. MB35-C1]